MEPIDRHANHPDFGSDGPGEPNRPFVQRRIPISGLRGRDSTRHVHRGCHATPPDQGGHWEGRIGAPFYVLAADVELAVPMLKLYFQVSQSMR